MLLIPCTFFLHSPLRLPTDNPPCDLHFCDSIPVLVVCLVYLFIFLGSVVDSCEFVVILLFIFLIFFFLVLSPFNISYNNGLVLMNSFNLFLAEKHFICPSILKNSFAG